MKKNEKLPGLLADQQEIKAATDKDSKIKGVTSEKKALLAGSDERKKVLAQKRRQAETTAAEVALGDAPPEDLEKLKKEIEALEKEVAADDSIRELVNGLQRKLFDAESEVRAAKNKAHPDLIAFLLTEAEILGAEYLASARQTVELFRRLMALDALLTPKGYPVSYGASMYQKISLPRFMLECHTDSMDQGTPYLLSETTDLNSTGGGFREKDVNEEKSRLEALGVDLDL